MTFATANNLVERFDHRLIGDLCSDDGNDLTLGQVLTDARVAAALDDASGEVLTNLQVGGNYTYEDLEGLTGLNRSHLVRVCCDIAMGLLIQRRPNRVSTEVADKIAEKAREHIRQLRKGENIFGFPEKVEAGNLHASHMQATQLEGLNLIPDRMHRYFPDQQQRSRRTW